MIKISLLIGKTSKTWEDTSKTLQLNSKALYIISSQNKTESIYKKFLRVSTNLKLQISFEVKKT